MLARCGPRSSFVLLLTAACVGQQTLGDNDLSGAWNYYRGGNRGVAEVEVTQEGTTIVGKYSSVDTADESGFGRVGDVAFRGTVHGARLLLRVHVHYPLSLREKCPDKWTPMEMRSHSATAASAEVWEGQEKIYTIRDDCSEKFERWQRDSLFRTVISKDVYGDGPPHIFTLQASGKEKPTRIILLSKWASATVGSPITVFIGLGGPTEPHVLADRDYTVHLHPTGGSVDPHEVAIPRGGSQATAKVQRDTPRRCAAQRVRGPRDSFGNARIDFLWFQSNRPLPLSQRYPRGARRREDPDRAGNQVC